MKKFITLLFLIVMSLVSAIAESVPNTEDDAKTDPNDIVEVADKALKLELVALNQEYPSKKIGFNLTVNPDIDSGRVVLYWYYPSNLYTIVGEQKSNITLTIGNIYSTDKFFTPVSSTAKLSGVTMITIGVKVSALVYEQNYITVIKKNFYIDNNFQLLPITDTYRQAKTEYEVMKLLEILGITAIGMLVVSFALGRFLNYVNSPDKEK